MAWTYSESLTTNRDKLRLRIGDTDTNDQLLSDETLDALLTARNADVSFSAVDAVRAIVAKLGREFDRNSMGMAGNRSQKVQHFYDLLKELSREARLTTGVIAGGISVAREDTIDADTDFKKPSFRVGQHDRERVGEDPKKTW